MHNSHHLDVVMGNSDPRFLARFTNSGGNDRFATIEMPGGNALVAVFVAGVMSSQQQDVFPSKKQQMNGNGKRVPGHPLSLSSSTGGTQSLRRSQI